MTLERHWRPATDHRHRLPTGTITDGLTESAIVELTTRNCPVCSAHDHTDTRPFGFTRHGEAVPAWWLTCPRCGDPEAAVHLYTTTPAGIAWRKTQDPAA